MTEPTDAELDELRQANSGRLNFVTLSEFRTIARAALAKWGAQDVPASQGDALSDDAVRVPLDSLHADAAYLIGRLREGSMPSARVIEIIRERIDAAKAAIRARAEQGDALDAARYRFLRDGEWRDTDLEPFIRLQLNTLWDAKIDAARAAQEGKSHG